MSKKEENPLTTEAYREVTGKPAAASLTIEYQANPFCTVQQQDTNRKETVKKLMQQFENHPNKESFLQDLKKTEKINTFSKESKKLITDTGNITEIFELCETSSKKQCPDCNLYWEIGIVYCSCGRCLKPSQSTKKLDKHNFGAVSIPGYVIKKNLLRGAKHGASERQRMYYKNHGDVVERSPTQGWWVQNHLER